MPWYRRAVIPGGTFFITIVTHERRPLLSGNLVTTCLHDAITTTAATHPFKLSEIVLLPDHFHMLISLPANDADLAKRIGTIKSTFTKSYLAAGGEESGQSESRSKQGYRGIWQKRYWEHWVRNDADLAGCAEYIWYNAVKHGLAKCPHQWAASSFHRAVKSGLVSDDWGCACDDGKPRLIIRQISGAEMD